jgi:hypothetical protein
MLLLDSNPLPFVIVVAVQIIAVRKSISQSLAVADTPKLTLSLSLSCPSEFKIITNFTYLCLAFWLGCICTLFLQV